MELQAAVCSPDGRRVVRAHAGGSTAAAAALGGRVAEQLIRDGATEILEAVRRTDEPGTADD
jgi:porphobilinogen deaminase